MTEAQLGKKRDYTTYFLKRNPFPRIGVPESNPRIFVDREQEFHEIIDAINTALNETSTNLVLVGSYGSGKTHTLKYTKSIVEKRFSTEKIDKVLVAYIESPGESFVDIYRKFIYDIGYYKFQELVWCFLGKVTLDLIREGKTDFFEPKNSTLIERELEKDYLNMRKLVDQGLVFLPIIIEYARKKLISLTKSVDFSYAFLQLTSDETSILAWKWISGEPLYSEQRRELKVASNIDKDEKALQAFIGLKNVLQLIHFKLIILLLDEFESIEILTNIKKQKLLNSIRHLIDLNPLGLCTIIACTPEAWQAIFKEYHAFSERIFKEITLKPLNREETKKLIEKYLALERTTSEDKIGNNLKTQFNRTIEVNLYPFTKDIVKDIFTASKGNIRKILHVCSLLLDMAVDKGITLIDKNTLPKITKDLLSNT
ncbi:MAG: DUF2791 family P-loop domain-containing protein [Candidatus Odinarchaeota archaeon]|nr:DUF2791 family P-loop domain-containing protein [Candidatus Odinarchaeota archaeon]